jgi:inward rectifier potassium channel
MAVRKMRSISNTGFGSNANAEGARLTNKDGSINLQKTGIPFWEKYSLYHSLLRMPSGKFLLCIFSFYTTINILFDTLYLLNGVKHLKGVEFNQHEPFSGFLQAFFFSSQTLTTVGYGHISPEGLGANIIASIESFIGILSFAMVTGILYGRFTRPKAFILFSKNMLIAPFQEGKALMIRAATYKNNHLTDVEAQFTIAMLAGEKGKEERRFYTLPLEISKINSMALNWTMVHKITDQSPLYDMKPEDFKTADVEVIVFIKAFDDHFSNIVQQRTSFTHDELIYGARFQPMFRKAEDGSTTILELDKISAHQAVTLD